jgi:hypothetical protein
MLLFWLLQGEWDVGVDEFKSLVNKGFRRSMARCGWVGISREAQVSRATTNRASDILAEWDARVSDSPAGTAARKRDDELDRLRQSLKASRTLCRAITCRTDCDLGFRHLSA